MTFKEYLNELKYKRDSNISKKNITLSDSKVEYKGKTQILHKTPDYFILTDLEENILFYVGYIEGRSKQIILGTRENVSDKRELFFRVVYTLLFLGYRIKEDYQHNDKSLRSIINILRRGHIIVKYNEEDITPELINNNFDDGTDNTFSYEIVKRDSSNLIERYTMWEGDDLFDTADEYTKTTIGQRMTFKEYLNEISFGKDKRESKPKWDELSEGAQSQWLNPGGGMRLNYKNLTSLNDLPFVLPEIWKGDFYCYDNNLTTLEGAPREVSGYFDCSYNKLTTLEGAPKEVGGGFDCTNNKLTTLEGAPKEVGGSFYCGDNSAKFTEEDVQKVCKVKGDIYA